MLWRGGGGVGGLYWGAGGGEGGRGGACMCFLRVAERGGGGVGVGLQLVFAGCASCALFSVAAARIGGRRGGPVVPGPVGRLLRL